MNSDNELISQEEKVGIKTAVMDLNKTASDSASTPQGRLSVTDRLLDSFNETISFLLPVSTDAVAALKNKSLPVTTAIKIAVQVIDDNVDGASHLGHVTKWYKKYDASTASVQEFLGVGALTTIASKYNPYVLVLDGALHVSNWTFGFISGTAEYLGVKFLDSDFARQLGIPEMIHDYVYNEQLHNCTGAVKGVRIPVNIDSISHKYTGAILYEEDLQKIINGNTLSEGTAAHHLDNYIKSLMPEDSTVKSNPETNIVDPTGDGALNLPEGWEQADYEWIQAVLAGQGDGDVSVPPAEVTDLQDINEEITQALAMEQRAYNSAMVSAGNSAYGIYNSALSGDGLALAQNTVNLVTSIDKAVDSYLKLEGGGDGGFLTKEMGQELGKIGAGLNFAGDLIELTESIGSGDADETHEIIDYRLAA